MNTRNTLYFMHDAGIYPIKCELFLFFLFRHCTSTRLEQTRLGKSMQNRVIEISSSRKIIHYYFLCCLMWKFCAIQELEIWEKSHPSPLGGASSCVSIKWVNNLSLEIFYENSTRTHNNNVHSVVNQKVVFDDWNHIKNLSRKPLKKRWKRVELAVRKREGLVGPFMWQERKNDG